MESKTYTIEELNKFTKLTLIDIIQDWGNDNKRHITNLRTAVKDKLINLIIEKNMPKKDKYISIQDNKEKNKKKKEEEKDKYTNPFKVGKYIYHETTDCDGDYIHNYLNIEIYKSTKCTISLKITKYGRTKEYKQRKVRYFSTGDAYVKYEEFRHSINFDKLKKIE